MEDVLVELGIELVRGIELVSETELHFFAPNSVCQKVGDIDPIHHEQLFSDSFCQKIKNTNCKHIKGTQNNFEQMEALVIGLLNCIKIYIKIY